MTEASPWPWWRSVLWVGLTLAVCVWHPGFPSFVENLRPDSAHIVDFFEDWASARNFLEGLPVYSNQEETFKRYLGLHRGPEERFFIEINAHPPTSVLLAVPLAWLDYRDAFLVWSLLSLAAFGVSLWVVIRYLEIPFQVWSLFPLVALLLVCNPFRQQLNQGQITSLLLLLMTGMWIADRTDRPWLAGLLLAAATALKLFPGIFILYFILRRQWKAVVVAAFEFSVITLVTVAVLGPQTYVDFIQRSIPSTQEWRSAWNNSSIAGFWNKLFYPGTLGGDIEPILLSPTIAQVGTVLCCGIVVLIVGRYVWRARTQAERDCAFALTLVAMLLVSPVAWEHYFVVLVLPAGLLWQRLPPGGVSAWVFNLVLVIMWLTQAWWELLFLGVTRPEQRLTHVATPWQTITGLSLYFYALLGMFGLLCLIGRRRSPPAEAEGPEAVVADKVSADEVLSRRLGLPLSRERQNGS